MLGDLPECEADQLLKLVPAVQPVKPRLINENKQNARDEGMAVAEDDLSKALNISRQMADIEDSALQKALAMSMQGNKSIHQKVLYNMAFLLLLTLASKSSC